MSYSQFDPRAGQYPQQSQSWPGQPPHTGIHLFDPNDPLVSQDYAGWWGRSVAALRRAWRPVMLLQLGAFVVMSALILPAQIQADFATARMERLVAETGELPFGDFLTAQAVLIAVVTAASVVLSVAMLASARIVVACATGGQPRIVAALGEALRRLPALVGWSLLTVPILIAAFVACFLPVIYVGAVFAVLPIVVLFERGNPIGRCFRLFHADLGAAVGRIATLVGIAFGWGIITTLASLAVTVGTSGLDPAAELNAATVIIGSIATTLVSGLSYVLWGLFTPFLVTTYADLRARHEPFTTAELMTAAPGAAAGPAPAPVTES